MPEINLPDVLIEVGQAFLRYEKALVDNDVATLNALFLDSPDTIRYGVAENLHGHAEIEAFRKSRVVGDITRTILRSQIMTYGRDMATTHITYRRHTDPGMVGRQSQTWMRNADGWRIVCAHVSMIRA